MVEIKAILIFEMLGRPLEHLKKTLSDFIDKLAEEDGVKVINKKVSEPKKLEDAKQEFYTTFAETEIDFKDLNTLLKILFIGMPAHTEVISPEDIKLKNFDLNTVINELTRRLHQYDEVVKRLSIERQMMIKQLQEQANILKDKKIIEAKEVIPLTKEIKGKSRKVKKTKKKVKKKK